jgi:hypothetical protein
VTGPNVIVGQEKEMSVVYGAEHLLRMLGAFLPLSNRYSGVIPRSSKPSPNGRKLRNGHGIYRTREGLCERAHAVRFPMSLLHDFGADLPPLTGGWRPSVRGSFSPSMRRPVSPTRMSPGLSIRTHDCVVLRS